jgi:hypothetical protein
MVAVAEGMNSCWAQKRSCHGAPPFALGLGEFHVVDNDDVCQRDGKARGADAGSETVRGDGHAPSSPPSPPTCILCLCATETGGACEAARVAVWTVDLFVLLLELDHATSPRCLMNCRNGEGIRRRSWPV